MLFTLQFDIVKLINTLIKQYFTLGAPNTTKQTLFYQTNRKQFISNKFPNIILTNTKPTNIDYPLTKGRSLVVSSWYRDCFCWS